MSIELEAPRSSTEQYEHYRALSTAAVASLILGLLSWLAILDWMLIVVPVVGTALGAYALTSVRRHRDEVTGEKLARIGLILSVLFLVTGPAWLTYEYLTEVPGGYGRISYSDLQPDPEQAGQQVPPSALELEGKHVFIKGYLYPGREKDGIKQFLLVRDQGDCCFGGNPKITDRIQVTLAGPLRVSYQTRLFKVGGKFHVAPMDQATGGAKGGVFYHLDADYVQ
jgi:Domain of unknown function (DUF4190)/Protein of unknown function (DUF3299)